MWSALKSFVFTTLSMVPFFAPPISPAMDFGVTVCENPAQRREWSTLSHNEKADWVRAVKCIADMPHNASVIATVHPKTSPPMSLNGSFYDDIVYVHMDLGDLVHATGYFLPWHRHYVHIFEKIMKDHCGYAGSSPYWDWRKDAADLYNAPLMNDPDPEINIGGWGNPAADYVVEEGVFAGLKLEYPVPHTLRRNFSIYPYLDYSTDYHVIPDQIGNVSLTYGAVQDLVEGNTGDYTNFQRDFEAFQGAHLSLHSIFGADMSGLCPTGSYEGCNEARIATPNDPIFWLHHAMVDKIWSEWQHHNPANKNAFTGGATKMTTDTETYDRYPNGAPPLLDMSSILPSNNLFGEVTIGDVMSTTSGYLCYVYV